jgi:dTDP-4-dehydrorhamnose reductase
MKILVSGCEGQVGWELVRSLQPLGEVIALNRQQFDLSDIDALKITVNSIAPDVIVNAAAYTAVDKAETNEVLANLINAQAPGILAAEAKKLGALFIHYSTDYVFDGEKSGAYTETDRPRPINIYGRSKLLGEENIQAAAADHIILRTSWVYAARGANFLQTILRLAKERETLNIIADQTGSPTWARVIAETTAHVIRHSQIERQRNDFQSAIYNVAGAGETSWHGFAEEIMKQIRPISAESFLLNEIKPIPATDYKTPAQRPMNSRLATEKIEKYFSLRMPSWDDALKLCISEYR